MEIIEDEEGVYLDFTLRNEFHEYEMIEEFIDSISEQEIQEALYTSIQGRGAFRRFKDGIIEHGVEKQWYEYKENRFKDLVTDAEKAFINWILEEIKRRILNIPA